MNNFNRLFYSVILYYIIFERFLMNAPHLWEQGWGEQLLRVV